MSKPATIYVLSEAITPITHCEGTEGNEAVFKRIDCYQGGRVRKVPALTGNSLRSVMLRRPGMQWLIHRLGIAGHLTRPEAYFLLAGGGSHQGGGGRESMEEIAELSACCPLAGLLGGCAPSQIYAGSVCVDFGMLLCRENADRINTFLPPGVTVPEGMRLRPADEWLARHQYYRHDHEARVKNLYSPGVDHAERAEEWQDSAAKKKPDTPAEQPLRGERDDGKSASMPFAGESIIPGAMFAHRIRLAHPTRLEMGAVLFSLRLWRDAGAVVGGMAARGHGQLRPLIHVAHAWHGADDEYAAYVADKAERIVAWLKKAYRPDREREAAKADKKEAKARKKAAAAAGKKETEETEKADDGA